MRYRSAASNRPLLLVIPALHFVITIGEAATSSYNLVAFNLTKLTTLPAGLNPFRNARLWESSTVVTVASDPLSFNVAHKNRFIFNASKVFYQREKHRVRAKPVPCYFRIESDIYTSAHRL